MEFLLDVLAEIFLALDGLTLLADLYSWMKGKQNRHVRREARRRGEPLPPRDGWNKAVIALSVAFLVLTTALVLWLK